MAINKTNIDTNVLPPDVLSLMDNQFYDFIRELTSSNEAEILKLQHINNVNAFLLTKNPLELLELNSSDVQDIRKRICFELENKTFVVKPGIKSNLQYLHDLFCKRMDEHVKDIKKKTKLSQATQESATEHPDDIKAFILRSIKRCCSDNQDILKLRDFQLQETEHFTLSLTDDGKAFIICKCGEKINLYKFRGKFQLSNFYRHYKASSCSMLENLRKEEEEKNYRMLSAIASTLPPSDSRTLLLASAQNPNGLDIPNSPSTSSPTELSTNRTSKRRADTENSNNIVSTSKKQKK
ncbi:unnamed protein product [Rotaria sp. Silwood1]|nr:unnamed protein product [Rotaria sp. Silwood1]CAF1683667.1 unnamed protein product [Rotaria sp. Silwood1]CAF3744969.1 unnamed protein product [Rotaria sp. Silwood1]CAF4825169.1 unnamed protein product [Rotaria sp. Silwood1]CAF5098267.1 unnamed protein product [Rotaria sp. Silwood1]